MSGLEFLLVRQDGVLAGLTYLGWVVFLCLILCPALTILSARSGPSTLSDDLRVGLIFGMVISLVMAFLCSFFQEEIGLAALVYLNAAALAVVALSILAWYSYGLWLTYRRRGG